VKVDIGVHVDGYIADTARTVDVDGTLEGFVAATDDALDEAKQSKHMVSVLSRIFLATV
jgi:methionine aminopeptidase